jgi:hypothetical protein
MLLLIALPLLGPVHLFQVLRVLITELVIHVLDRLINPLLTTQTDDGANPLLDTPSCRNACHADIVFLCDLLDAADDLLVDLIFAAVNEALEELVGLRTAGGAVGPWAGEGTTGDGGPGDQSYAGVLTVRDLDILSAKQHWSTPRETHHLSFFLTVDEVVVVLHAK